MDDPSPPSKPKKRHRDHGDDGISWDKINKCYVGTISLGFKPDGKRVRRTVRGKTKAEVKDNLDKAPCRDQRRDPHAGHVHHRAVRQGLARLDRARRPHAGHLAQPGQEVDLSERSARPSSRTSQLTDADRFFKELGKIARQALADDDQEHASPVHPPSAGSRPHRQERGRADRPPSRPARPPITRHDRSPSRQGTQDGERQGNGLRQGREGQQGPLWRDPRGHRDRRASLRHQAAHERADHRSEPRDQGSNVPLMSRPTRHRRGRRRQPSTRSALRPGDHARPAPWRTAPAHVGPRRPERGSGPRLALGEQDRRHQDPQVEALAHPAEARHRRSQGTQGQARPRAPRSRRSLARQQPRVLPRERRPLHVRRAQLALLQDDQEGRHRPLARPRRPTHRSLDHEQQRRTDPRDQRHGRPQVNPRNRDRLPPCDRPRDPRWSDGDGRHLRRRRRTTKPRRHKRHCHLECH